MTKLKNSCSKDNLYMLLWLRRLQCWQHYRINFPAHSTRTSCPNSGKITVQIFILIPQKKVCTRRRPIQQPCWIKFNQGMKNVDQSPKKQMVWSFAVKTLTEKFFVMQNRVLTVLNSPFRPDFEMFFA